MIVTRTDEGAAKQFVDEPRLPITFEPGNPFAFRQEAVITTLAERERSFDLQPLITGTGTAELLQQPLAQIFENQVSAALADLASRPDNPYSLNNVAVAYLNVSRFEEAEDYLRRALEIDPGLLMVRANLAKLYTATKRLPEALGVYEELVKVEPENTVFLMNMAQIYVQMQDFERSRDLLDKVIAIDPEIATAYNNRGLLNVIRGRTREAVADLRSALRLHVRNAIFHNNLGTCYILINSPRKAIRAFKAALALDPLNEDATKNLSQTYLAQKMPEAAIGILAELVQRREEETEARNLLAKAYFLSGRLEQSIRQLTAALRVAETTERTKEKARTLNNLGVVFRAMGQADRAHEFFKQSLAIRPENLVALRNFARLQFEQGRLDNAQKTLDLCLSFFPEDHVALTLMGACYGLREEYNVAIEYYNRAIASDPKHPLPYGWLTTILADVYNDYHTAIARLKEGLRYNPKDSTLLNNLAYVCLLLNDTSQARRILDGIDHRDYNTYLYATRGLLLLKEGDVQEGTRLYNLAARLAETEELRNQVTQKRNLELAQHALRSGDRDRALHLLRHVSSIRTAEKLHQRQISALLQQLQRAAGEGGNDNRE